MVRINLCAKAFKEEQKETRLGLVEAMETFVVLLAQIQAFIYEYPTGKHCTLEDSVLLIHP